MRCVKRAKYASKKAGSISGLMFASSCFFDSSAFFQRAACWLGVSTNGHNANRHTTRARPDKSRAQTKARIFWVSAKVKSEFGEPNWYALRRKAAAASFVTLATMVARERTLNASVTHQIAYI